MPPAASCSELRSASQEARKSRQSYRKTPWGEHLDVAGPAEPLVALRAVGGYVEEVAPHAPRPRSRAAGRPGVRAGEPAGALHVGVDHLGADRGRVELARPALDLGVAEAVEGELRLPGDRAVRRRRVSVSVAFAGPQRPGAELVVLQHLGVPQGDHGAGRPVDGQPQPADEVLAEVEHRPAGRGGDHLLDGQLLDPADRPAMSGLRGGDRRRAARPVASPESSKPGRTSPDRGPRVVSSPGVDAAGRSRARCGAPGLVGDHHLSGGRRRT